MNKKTTFSAKNVIEKCQISKSRGRPGPSGGVSRFGPRSGDASLDPFLLVSVSSRFQWLQVSVLSLLSRYFECSIVVAC